MEKNIKAVAMLSGGLDSILAIKVLLEQGIDITALYFAPPFIGPDEKGKKAAEKIAGILGIPLRVETMGLDYLEIIKHPKHGYGTGMNPCIDCKIYMLKSAKKIADETGAGFVVTGEVLNQRPMSQHRIALNILEKESELKGRLLRPLSAGYLPETDAEKNGSVDRNGLLSIIGRSRKIQIAMAKEKGICEYIPAAGGCLLTDKLYSKKLRDLLQFKEDATWEDILILNTGRHFRYGENKIIVGRNEKENDSLLETKRPGDFVFQLPDEIPGPTVILLGPKTGDAIQLAAALALRYSDLKTDRASVIYGENNLDHEVPTDISVLKQIDYYNISSGTKE